MTTLSDIRDTIAPVILTDGKLTATLYNADCLEVLPTLAPESVRMMWTDPPYGHANHDGDFNSRLNDFREIESKPITNDTPEQMREVVSSALALVTPALSADYCCCCCCCCGGGPKPTFAWVANQMDQGELSFFHSVIWDKRNPGLGWRFRRQHEMVMVSHRKGGRLSWADDALAVPNIMSIAAPREREHPNQKPVELPAKFVELCTKEGETVLDPFMGSGTTGVACVRTGRNFVGVEIDPSYFKTACERIDRELRQGRLFQ